MMKSSLMLAAAAVFVLTGCNEINQQEKTQKGYAGKQDEKPYAGQQFGADRTKWEVALKQRGQTQNEYLRTEPAR
jgi:uncharacterized lipoprotein NlpE involved in copper resistance